MAAEATLQTIIDEAREYAEESYVEGDRLIQQAWRSARAYIDGPEYRNYYRGIETDGVDSVEDPGNFNGNITIPSDKPILETFGPVHIPTFDDLRTAPDAIDTSGLFEHPLPDGTIPPLDANEPTLNDPTLPTTPVLDDVQFPTLRPITTPDAPDIALPQFDGVLPANPPAAPGDLKCMFENAYDQMLPQMQSYIDNQVTAFIEKYYPDYSANMASAQTRLEEMMNGKALPDEIEQAIFDRARGRVDRETMQAEDAAFNEIAQRGFTLPPGMLVSELQRGHQSAADRIGNAAIDIAVKQAEIAQSNLQFAINAVLTLQEGVRSAAIQYASALVQTNGQALQYAQTIVQTAVQLYEIQVRQFQTEVELYKAYSVVYELEIKAELAKIQIFEAEVKLAELLGTLNELDVRLVSQKVELSKNKIELYAEQIRAVALELDVQGQQVELFKAQVEAYLARVKVKESEFSIYEAAMRGDETKVRANLAEFEAYRAEAAAYTAAGNLEVAQMEGDIKRNDNILEKFKAELLEYTANIDVSKTQFEGDLRAYLAGLDRYARNVDKAIAEAKFDLDAQIADREQDFQRDKLEVDARNMLVTKFVNLTKIEADTAVSGAQIYARIAEAAVSAQHTMVQLVNQTVQ